MLDLSKSNIDAHVVKSKINLVVSSAAKDFNGWVLDIGCGKMPYRDLIITQNKVKKYVGLDLVNAIQYDSSIKPDFTWDGIKMPFDSESFETAMATEVLEHCFNPLILLNETFRVLKPGGKFFLTVPFLWPLHEIPNDAYRYTPWSLERLLKESGFSEIQIQPLGGWHAAMAQMTGLWVARSSMGIFSRRILTRLAIPFMKWLLKKEKGKKITFAEGQMITGLYGTARKR